MNTREIAEEYRLTHWAEIIQERKESGLSVRAFCKGAGFHENIYFYWQRKLREATCEELSTIRGKTAGMVPSGFTELKLASRTTLPTMIADNRERVCIETSGLRITASNEYPIDKLVTLMREVTRLC